MTDQSTRTVDEALERFTLLSGTTGDEWRNEACAMTALAWVAGEAWTDHPECAHRWLADLSIGANDDLASTVEDREAIVRSGETGVLDTWWIPDDVVACCISLGEGERRADKVLGTIDLISWWKADKQRADLRDAYLRDADLRDADLRGANLRDADLGGADLRDADLRGADLRDADLRDADLRDANLRDADLGGAYLRDADLRGADLRDANLRDADLGGADLRDADLRGAYLRGAYANEYTQWPIGFDRARLSA